MEPDEAILRCLCHAILRYLARHPDAADTVCGIANWWLPESERDVSERMIERALDRLVEAGRVTKYVLVDGSVLYAHRVAKQDGKAR
ncbi:hypothetical protein F6X40_12795 [Paraburkholderia sp. UCT31]|uniref:hypothetical protein n=1 Tax=Paraburkholderia sp. UCT31 TaxID=2615209 RepID=UPI001655B194|nr:hypothetical protein [Paraburkholderia sp. UCT31]MBC8737677.1 hypothetical protein [Paraburkholderia sp. UCT31]